MAVRAVSNTNLIGAGGKGVVWREGGKIFITSTGTGDYKVDSAL